MANAAVASAAERGEQLKRDNIVIRTYDLWKTYIMGDQEINAVSGVDIEIKRGEYVAIMGPSGSGKSTLMNLIGCLDTPSKGEYFINGNLVSEMSDDRSGAHPQQGDRVRFPDVQPAASRDGAAQRRTAADLRRHTGGRAHRTREAGPDGSRSGTAHAPQAERVLGRSASARRHCACAGESAVDSAGRRADR